MARKLQKIILKLLLLTTPFQPVLILQERFLGSEKWQFGTLAVYSGELFILLAVGIHTYIAWKRIPTLVGTSSADSETQRARPAWVYWLMLFIFYSYLPAFWSTYPDLAIQKSRYLVEAILAFYLIHAGGLEKGAVWKYFSVGTMLTAGLGITQFLTQSSFNFKWLGIVGFDNWATGAPIIAADGERWLRAFGSFGSPNIFGGWLFLFIFLLFHRKKNPMFRSGSIWFYVLLAISSLALFFSWSRSAMAAFFILISIHAVKIINKKDWQMLPTVVMPVLIFFILGTIFQPLLYTRLTADSINEKISYKERSSGYIESIKMVKSNILLGVGNGNYTSAKKNNFPAHNVFLLFLAENGLLGLALLIALFLSLPKLNWLKHLDLIALLPILLFDHYLYSGWQGLLMAAIFLAFFIPSPQSVPNPSPARTHSI